MDPEKVEYLKKRYRESPSSEKIKFSDIQEDLASHFPTASWNARIVSETVRAVFPQSESKQHGRSHSRYIHGIEESQCEVTASSSSAMVLLDAERKKNEALLLRIRDLEVENERLQRATLQLDVLENQLQQLMNPWASGNG